MSLHAAREGGFVVQMTPYTERRHAGHYDTKPVKTPASEKSTTTEKLSGLTGAKGKAKK